jgi:hypothetical protein
MTKVGSPSLTPVPPQDRPASPSKQLDQTLHNKGKETSTLSKDKIDRPSSPSADKQLISSHNARTPENNEVRVGQTEERGLFVDHS